MTGQQKQAALLRDALIVLDQVEQYLDMRANVVNGRPNKEIRLIRDVTQILNRGWILNRGCGWGKLPPGSTGAIPALQPVTTTVRTLTAPEFTGGKS